MRDLLLVSLYAVALPLMVWRPAWGALGWVWFGIFNPHRYAWGFATTIPFATAAFVATVVGALFSREPKRLKGGAATAVLIIFACYTVATTSLALVPDSAWRGLETTLKVQFGTLLVLTILYRKDHVLALIWVVAGSIGFYAIKGGIFTLATLGQHRVFGPDASNIADNNAFALATIVSIPLWAFLYTQYRKSGWARLAIIAAIGLSATSAIGSQSRGAVLAIIATAAFLWFKSRLKLALGAVTVIAAIGFVTFMPEQWEARIATIANPRADASANSRLETWTMLFNLANDRPLTGGGFGAYSDTIYAKYNPTYTGGSYAAHSIYFQVLGEHGWVAFFLFVLFWALVWRMCSQVANLAHGQPDHHWAYWLAQMVKVSMVAFFVGGAFLNLAYWDVPYYLFVAIAITRSILRQAEAREPSLQIASSDTERSRASAILPGSPATLSSVSEQRDR